MPKYDVSGDFFEVQMKNLWEGFSYSVASELLPSLSQKNNIADRNKFALFLAGGETLAAEDVMRIRNKCCLEPVFFALTRDLELDVARSYARKLDSTVRIPKNLFEFAYALKECSFSISEDAVSGVLSFFSDTPAYLNSGSEDCRAVIGELTKHGISYPFFIPYTKNRSHLIRSITVSDNEFLRAKKKLRNRIGTKLLDFSDI
jgi:hypothetical protein